MAVMAMQQISEMLGVNIFFLFHPVSWHVCGCIGVNRERIISLHEGNLRRIKKNDWGEDKKLLWVLFFPCCKGEKNPFVLFSCLDVTFYTAFPSILSFPILKAVAVSHKYSCGTLLPCWGLSMWASSSSSIPRASPLQSHSLLRRAWSGFSGLMLIAWELVMFHFRVNSTLSAFHNLWSKPCCKTFPFIWAIGGWKNFLSSVSIKSKIMSLELLVNDRTSLDVTGMKLRVGGKPASATAKLGFRLAPGFVVFCPSFHGNVLLHALLLQAVT